MGLVTLKISMKGVTMLYAYYSTDSSLAQAPGIYERPLYVTQEVNPCLYQLNTAKKVWGINIIGELTITSCEEHGIEIRLPGMCKFTLIPGVADDKLYVDTCLEPDTDSYSYLVASDRVEFYSGFLRAVAEAFKFDVEELHFAMWHTQNFNGMKLEPEFDEVQNEFGIGIRTRST
jgi:hypothetical protein